MKFKIHQPLTLGTCGSLCVYVFSLYNVKTLKCKHCLCSQSPIIKCHCIKKRGVGGEANVHMYQWYLAGMFIFHNIPLPYNLSMEETNIFFQTLWTSETRVKWEHTVPAFIRSAFWPVHWATRTRTLLTFTVPSSALSPVLANSHLYYHGSNWQGRKSQGTRPIAFPAVCGCIRMCICRQTLQWLVIIKTNLEKWVPAKQRLKKLLTSVKFIRKCQPFANGLPWWKTPSLVSSVWLLPARASHTNVPPHLHLQ